MVKAGAPKQADIFLATSGTAIDFLYCTDLQATYREKIAKYKDVGYKDLIPVIINH